MTNTVEVIDALVDVFVLAHSSARDKLTYRNALNALVNLARAEMLREMQEDFNRMTIGPICRAQKAK